MTGGRFGPKRPLAQELLSLAPLGVLCAATALAFPREAMRFDGGPKPPEASEPSCCFVDLGPSAASQVGLLVHGPLYGAQDDLHDLKADLSISTVAEDAPESVIGIESRSRRPPPAPLAWRRLPAPVSVAAPSPDVPPEAVRPDPDAGSAFTRKQLLIPTINP